MVTDCSKDLLLNLIFFLFGLHVLFSSGSSRTNSLLFVPILGGGFGISNKVGTAPIISFFFEGLNISSSKCALHILILLYKYFASFFKKSLLLQFIAHLFDLLNKNHAFQGAGNGKHTDHLFFRFGIIN